MEWLDRIACLDGWRWCWWWWWRWWLSWIGLETRPSSGSGAGRSNELAAAAAELLLRWRTQNSMPVVAAEKKSALAVSLPESPARSWRTWLALLLDHPCSRRGDRTHARPRELAQFELRKIQSIHQSLCVCVSRSAGHQVFRENRKIERQSLNQTAVEWKDEEDRVAASLLGEHRELAELASKLAAAAVQLQVSFPS